MRRSRAHLVMSALVVVLTVCLVVPAQAFAALEDDPRAESSTNPNWPNGDEIWWRDGWGNDPFPNIIFKSIPSDQGSNALKIQTLGFYYWVTRGSAPDTDTVPALNATIDPEGTMHEQTFDLAGLYADPGLGLQGTGSMEGPWVVWIAFYNRFRASSTPYPYVVGYDATPPSAITNLVTSASTGGGDVSGWTETTRRYLRWTPAIDAMSGIGVYRYELNGKFIGYHPGVLPGQYMSSPVLTLESLPAGKNKITLTPLDRATNAGPTTTTYAYVDPDVPVVKLTAPSASIVGASPTLKATATDAAGVRNVKFFVNSTLVYTDTTAPYEYKASLSGYAHGSWLKLSAVAEDMFGHTATASKTCQLDKYAPTLSSVSDAADPFYPVRKDGYKDTSKVRFTLGEKATVVLRVYSAAGKVVREMKTTLDRGARSISWNGKDSGGVVKTGTFYYKLTATDAAGNARSTAKFATHIRDYEIVRVSSRSVRVIPR